MNIAGSYKIYAERFAERTALRFKDETYSYREWHAAVSQTAGWLAAYDDPKKRIGILLNNGPLFLQLFAGAAAAGWTAVPLDPKWKPREMRERLEATGVSFVVTAAILSEKFIDLPVSVIHEDDCKKQMLEASAVDALEDADKMPFYMGFTSGTTGRPKAFLRAHDSWVNSFRCNIEDFHLPPAAKVLIPGQLIHSHFLYGAVSTLYFGGTVVLLEKFNAGRVLDELERGTADTVFTVPTMNEALGREQRTLERRFRIISSGAKWQAASKQRLKDRFPGLQLYEFYGASELSFVSYLSGDDHQRKPKSVGKPFHNVLLEIRNNDRTCAPFERGKIFVKSDMTFLGYLGEHREPPQDGWHTVDDIGYLDEDGYLYIEGRENMMILYGGINVFPEEVETVLQAHPDIEEAAVIGTTDDYWGQLVTAVVKGEGTRRSLQAWCKQRLSAYKIPRRWHFVDELPHTPGGKIDRRRLAALVESEVSEHA
ncbi:MAG TPA: AMP-binding protein [Bacillales bacterium]|nr:AMP-binding protein [Bacillales bacterium]